MLCRRTDQLLTAQNLAFKNQSIILLCYRVNKSRHERMLEREYLALVQKSRGRKICCRICIKVNYTKEPKGPFSRKLAHIRFFFQYRILEGGSSIIGTAVNSKTYYFFCYYYVHFKCILMQGRN